MDRQIIYPGAIPMDADLLLTNKNAMLALGALAQAMVGTATSVFGLGISSPSGLNISIAPGGIFSQEEVDATAYGSIAADTSDTLVKCGFNLAATSFTLTAPGTSGQSINYLIEATFAETDANAVVLPYYNAANPSQPYLGPNNDGAAQNTLRQQRCSLQLKAGAAANTGTQTTPSVDSDWVGLWVITINEGQTTITSSSWSEYPDAPFLVPGQHGMLLNVQTFTTSGTYTPTLGTNSVIVECQGAGASGGSCAAPNNSAVAAISGGGSGGTYGKGRYTSGFSGATVTVGLGGAVSAVGNNAGNAGGTSSFGSLLTCPGGPAGSAGTTVTPPTVSLGGSISGNASGANLWSVSGAPGTPVTALASNVGIPARGGDSFMGKGGQPPGNAAGLAGTGYGAGGSGIFLNGADVTGQQGGVGWSGIVIVWEYS